MLPLAHAACQEATLKSANDAPSVTTVHPADGSARLPDTTPDDDEGGVRLPERGSCSL